jgi:cation diffusion facilitator family transporter
MAIFSGIEEKKRVAASSVVAAVFITGFKLVIGLQTNSLGILSEAAHSGLDLLAAVMTLIAVTIAERPPDADHQYGHGKIENLSAFLETMLLVVTCAWIIWEAIDRLTSGATHVDASIWGFLVMGVSIVVDVSRSRALARVAKKHHSQALEADALHFSSDVWSSCVVIAGLGLVALGYQSLDSIAAILVALLVLFVSYRLGRRTIDALMDRVPAGLPDQLLEEVRKVPGVEDVRGLRVRPSGAHAFVDVVIGIRRTTPFEQAHRIMDNVEKALVRQREKLEAMVHAEPFISPDETVEDKIRMIVADMGFRAPHNIEIVASNGRYFIDFDIEYPSGKSFVEAHDVSSDIEREIQRIVPSVEKITIHMEEHQPEGKEAVEATWTAVRLHQEIKECLTGDSRVVNCSDVTLLEAGNKFNLTLACQFQKEKPLAEVHQIISELESMLYKRFKLLRRVTIHAEPA